MTDQSRSLRHRYRVDPRRADAADALGSPVLLRMRALWDDLREGSALPRRSRFDPLLVPADLLPHILLVDVSLDRPPRFRWRLVGTHTTGSVGRDATGAWFDELYPDDYRSDIERPYRRILASRAPVRWSGDVAYLERDWLTYEVIGMPMSEDGERIDIILLGAHYRSP